MRRSTPLRVFLVDDHPTVRQAVRSVIESSPDAVVVGEAGSVAEALASVGPAAPDVALLDVRLPDGNGIELCRALRDSLPHVACVMLTSYSDDEALRETVLAGACGYVLKQVRGAELVSTLRAVAAGHRLVDPVVQNRVLAHLADPAGAGAVLDAGDRELLWHVGAGDTDSRIATELGLDAATVTGKVHSLLERLGVIRPAAIGVTRG